MVGNQKVSWQQCTVLIMVFSMGTSILVIPSSLASIAKQDAWIAPILGTGLGLLIIRLYTEICTSFPNMDLIELNEFIFGKWIGRTVSLIFSFFCLLSSAQVLYYVGNFLTTQIMPETPIEVIHILFMAVIVMGVRLGLETIARTAEVFIPWVIFLFIIFLLSISQKSQLKNIQPIFETGILPILNATLTFLSYSCLPLVVLLAFFPKGVNWQQQIQKSFSIGYVAGSILMIILTLFTILVLGPDLTSRLSYSVYALAKGINVGNFLQRIEAIIAGIWFITIYFKLTFYFFASVLSISQTFKLRDYRQLVFPMGIIVLVLSLVVYPNSAYMETWDSQTWTPYVLSIGLFYPLLLLILSKLKHYFFSKSQHHK